MVNGPAKIVLLSESSSYRGSTYIERQLYNIISTTGTATGRCSEKGSSEPMFFRNCPPYST